MFRLTILYIYAKYVRVRSVAEVNVDYECRETIETELHTPTPSLFDEAKFIVLDLIKYDLYLKFIDSDIYRNFKGNSQDAMSEGGSSS